MNNVIIINVSLILLIYISLIWFQNFPRKATTNDGNRRKLKRKRTKT